MNTLLHNPGHRALRRGRVSEPGRAYLVTFATQSRIPLFADFLAARCVVGEMRRATLDGLVESMAWVVMPDHVHWLFMLRSPVLEQVLHEVKGRSARAVNGTLCRTGTVWQKAYHDHALRKEEDVQAAARYIIANPLRAGIVARLGDYPHWDAVWLPPYS